MKKKPILTLDFDGVLHSYSSGWKGAAVIPDPPVPGALEFVVNALERYTVAIHSSRSHQWGGKRAMKRWLFDNLFVLGMSDCPKWWFDKIAALAFADPWEEEVRDAANRVISEIQWPWFKPPAIMTIDDRAMTFTGVWPTLDEIAAFKPWNKA